MTDIGAFSVPDARKIAAHVAGAKQLPRSSVLRRRHPRGESERFYAQFIVYVTVKAGSPGGVDTSGEFALSSVATWAYHCQSPDGFSYMSRTDPDNNYIPGLPIRDTFTAPIQPEAQRVFGIEYEFAKSGSVGWAFINEFGDFVLLSVNELPVMEDACP